FQSHDRRHRRRPPVEGRALISAPTMGGPQLLENNMTCRRHVLSLALLTTLAPFAAAQGTRADYERANGLRARFENLATGLPDPATFIENTNEFMYRRFVKGGYEFVVV